MLQEGHKRASDPMSCSVSVATSSIIYMNIWRYLILSQTLGPSSPVLSTLTDSRPLKSQVEKRLPHYRQVSVLQLKIPVGPSVCKGDTEIHCPIKKTIPSSVGLNIDGSVFSHFTVTVKYIRLRERERERDNNWPGISQETFWLRM